MSGVITDIFNIKSNVLSFAKIRGSWAQVGGDTDPYQLNPTVSFGDGWNAGTKLLNLFVPNTLPNTTLKPQKNESIESELTSGFSLTGSDLISLITIRNLSTRSLISLLQLHQATLQKLSMQAVSTIKELRSFLP